FKPRLPLRTYLTLRLHPRHPIPDDPLSPALYTLSLHDALPIANVRMTSTRYLTSRKNKLAADRRMPRPVVNITRMMTRLGTHSSCPLTPTPRTARKTTSTSDATPKSASCESMAATGNTSRGSAIFFTRLLLAIKLAVANRMDEMKNAHGTARTLTAAMSPTARGTRAISEKPYRTTTPAETITTGMRMAQSIPITDCLYFTRISRHVIM